MMPDEVRKMDNTKCLIFIRGFDPVLDEKYVPFHHPLFYETADGDGEPYVHRVSLNGEITEPAFAILNQNAMAYYQDLQAKGEPVFIDCLNYEEFRLLGQVDMERRFAELDEEQQKERFLEEEQPELTYDAKPFEMQQNLLVQPQERKFAEEMLSQEVSRCVTKNSLAGHDENESDSIFHRLMHMSFTKEQKAEVKRAMDINVPKDVILSYFYPETPVTRMMEIRRQYEE